MKKADQNLIEFERKDENNMDMAKNTVIPIVYTVVMVIGIFVCCICDAAISGTFTWSLIPLSSILFAWIVSFPILLLGKRGILISMVSVSIFLIPFIYILSVLIKTMEVFSIGVWMSVLTLVFLWVLFALYHRLKDRKLLAAGITFLLAIPFTLLVNLILSKMLGEPVIDIWDMISAFILLVIAAAFIVGDHVRRNRYRA